ncbi:MAG TPA: IS1 family transposase, partial [Opitutaceae bacterium]
MANILSKEKRASVARCLVEGLGIRATCRITGVCKPAVLRLLALLGDACRQYQDATLRGLSCKRVECDEIWSFIQCKQQNLPPSERGFGRGDVYTWTAIDPDSKLVICWHVGAREAADSIVFMDDVASRLAHRVQLTTDGFKGYLRAVENAFGSNVDFGTEVKTYRSSSGPAGRTDM